MATTTRVVADRFRLIEPLGRGGMGTVWRAEDQVLGRIVALKEVSLPSTLPESERIEMRERVMREARAAARLSHSSAVTVFDVIEEDDKAFIAMEMVDSPTLADIVAGHGPLSPGRAAFIGLRLLDTLEAAHAKGIVHRDVKPANVMVDDQVVKLADFGIASVKGDPQLTATGLLLGSPSYMSPEQASGGPAGPPSDLWALGATLYFAVEGKGPFDREGPLPTLLAIANEEPPEPASAGPLAPAIRALLAKDPADRPTPATLQSMLESVVEAEEPEGPDLQVPPLQLLDEAAEAAPPVPAVEPAADAKRLAAERLAAIPDLEPTLREPVPEPILSTVREDRLRSRTAVTEVDRPPPPPRAQPVAEPSVNKSWPLVAAIAALLLLAVVLVPRLFSDPAGQEPAAQTTGTAPDAAGGGVQATAGTNEASGGREAGDTNSPSSEDTTARSQQATARSGWRSATLGDTRYAIAHPASWSVRNNALGDGSSVRFQGPEGKYLLVDWTDDPGPDALAAWEEQAASFARRHSNYREIRLEESEFQDFPTAAIWEWTYTSRGAELHAINLGFADDSHGFALNFQTRAADWEASQETFDDFKASFGKR